MRPNTGLKAKFTMTSAALVILGMHRSGTSCLAGCLEEAGLVLGQVDRKAHTNPKGNRENIKVMELNNAVLAANDASWNKPPVGPCHWSIEHSAWRDQLIASYPQDRLWGFKDPRTLLLLDGWLKGLPNAQLVGTFRHPLAVAGSLQARNGFAIEKGIELWTSYNRLLLQSLKASEFPLICFDWSTERYDGALRELAYRVGLIPPVAGFSFFEGHLRRNSNDPDLSVPTEAQDIYDQLLQISGTSKAGNETAAETPA